MSLGTVLKAPPVVWLAPKSGVQFIDLGFQMKGVRDLPSKWAFADESGMEAPMIVGREDDEPKGRVTYEIDWRRVTECFGRSWVPLPMFRREPGGEHEKGPVNWARVQIVPLAAPDVNGFDHRLVIAFDTNLSEEASSHAYLAPTQEDTQRGAEFSLAAAPEELGWFAAQSWIKEWCRTAFTEMIREEERARSSSEPIVDEAMVADRMEGQAEDVARYMALIDLLSVLKIIPGIRIIDRVTQPRPVPIDVDLVLDLGNSRTCGLMMETHPDELSADVTQAVKLNLRDLSCPEQVYTDPFDSRIEFNRASFGSDDISFLSGRSDAFSWPTVARVGVEAARLSSMRRGSEGSTGMSSPKRYLWDEDPRRDGWRFNSPAQHDQATYATGVEFTTLVNDAGEPLHSIPPATGLADDRSFPSIRALYARSHLMSFALAEIFLQALCMMNSPAHRLRRRNADLPRRLRRIIMTMPTGMALAERQLLIKRAEAARDLIYVCQNLAEVTGDAEDPVRPVDTDIPLPDVVLQWDEASATQAAFLYSQVAIAHSGNAREFFARNRLPANKAGGGLGDDFRLATLDIGGGTSDLVITSYTVEGKGANVTLFPRQLLSEGISVAGDDIVRQIIVEHVLEPLEAAFRDAGMGERAAFLMHRLFGGDRGDMDVEDQIRRQKFAAHVGHPLALRLIAEYERWDRLSGQNRGEPLTLQEALGSHYNAALIEELDREIQRHGNAAFSLREMRFEVDLVQIDRTARSVMTDVLNAFAELVHRSRADMLILSGRPSRMPAAFDILAESCALPPHRILPLHQFRVGQWYPFRDYEAKIADPKTTAAVGAMICMLGEGRLRNFNYRSDHLRARSTARFFGKLDGDNRLTSDNVFYEGLNLDDPDYELPDTPFEFRGPMSLGSRQFEVDWWPGQRLYSIDYASPESASKLNARTPLKIELQRATGRGNKGVVDAFSVRRVEDVEGRTVASREIRLWLQTIDQSDGFWLDTGVLLNT